MIDTLMYYADGFRWLLFGALALAFYRIVNNPGNDLEWTDFIATKGVDGRYHGDWDKVGKGSAVVIGSWGMIALIPYAKTDLKGYAVVLVTYFTYAGAVNGWAAYLRSKSGQTQTVTVTEPAIPPGPTKTTVTESAPAPSKDKPVPIELVAGPGKEEPLKTQEQNQ